MSQYATRDMISWSVKVISGLIGLAVLFMSVFISYAVDEHEEHPHKGAVDVHVFSALNGAQNKVVQGLSKRVVKTEDEVDENHEMIKDVQTRLTGIETALEFLVEKAKNK